MGESWRFRPVHASGHICPVCSCPHFPFCPPPPGLGFHHAEDAQLRGFSFPPLADNYRMPPPPPPMAPPMRYPPDPWSYHPPAPAPFVPDALMDRNGSYKRMRVEGPAPDFGNQPALRAPTLLSHGPFDAPVIRVRNDDERRLSLIRDHGKQAGALLADGGEYHRDGFAGEGTQFYEGSTGRDRCFDSSRSIVVGRNGPATIREPALAHGGLLSNTYEEHGDMLRERMDYKKLGRYNTYPGEHGTTPNERKDFGRNTEIFERHRDDARSNAVPLDIYDTGKLGEYPPSTGQHHERNEHDSSYALAKQPQYLEPGCYSTVNYERARFEVGGQHREDMRVSFDSKSPVPYNVSKPIEPQAPPAEPTTANSVAFHRDFQELPSRMQAPQAYSPLPPTSFPIGYSERSQIASSSPAVSSNLFPVLTNVSGNNTSIPPITRAYSESYALPHAANGYIVPPVHASGEINYGASSTNNSTTLKQYPDDGFWKAARNQALKVTQTLVNAVNLFKKPERASRPDHFVIILRGLPGSGKSYLVKALRDLEVENGGSAPRIHALDDYFMVEVEKNVEDNDGSKSLSVSTVKKQLTKKVIEYCYESEMEEVYRSSMLKAFKKTLDEGNFNFVIVRQLIHLLMVCLPDLVDDRNLRVADFAQFWAVAKRSGYEVYLLEAPYKDPMGCAARNVHGFTLDDIQKMAAVWEEAPPLYLQLDIQSLFRGDDLNQDAIQEVDMDTNDAEDDAHNPPDKGSQKPMESHIPDKDSPKSGESWHSEEVEEEEEPPEVKGLGSSKWSKDLDDDDRHLKGAKGDSSALSGLVQTYGKSEKSVHWGDKGNKVGFLIGAVRKRSTSLIIGPGSGYNLVSNPLVEEQDSVEAAGQKNIASDSKRHFSDQLRAERESFRAVFDKRRQRIGGLYNTEDD